MHVKKNLRIHDAIPKYLRIFQIRKHIQRIILRTQLPPPSMHTPTQHLILHRHLPLGHLVRLIPAQVTRNAVALAAPGGIRNRLPYGGDVDGHSLSVQDAAIRGLVDELERHVARIVVADAVAEVDVDGIADCRALEHGVVEVFA